MLVRSSSVVIGAILGCWMLSVAAGDAKSAVAKLNKFLVDATGPDVIDLETNVEKAEAKLKAGRGLFESSELTTAINAFLTVARSKSCSLEFANAMGYLAYWDNKNTRLERVIKDRVWNKEVREQCIRELDNLANELLSRLPKDEAMQSLLRNNVYEIVRGGYLDTPTPFSGAYSRMYRRENRIAPEALVKIAEDNAIVLVENKLDETTGELVSKRHDRRYNDLVNNYFIKQCRIHTNLSFNFTQFVTLLKPKLTDKDYDSLPEQVRNIYYRVRVCSLFYKNYSRDNSFAQSCKDQVMKRYSENHPAAY